MRILAFTDTHASLRALKTIVRKAEKADVLVCGGDISIFQHGLEETLFMLNDIGKPVVIVHGNHEDEEVFAELCEHFENIFNVHKSVLIVDDVAFLGYGGGGFALVDKVFERLLPKMLKEVPEEVMKRVLLLHQPPYGTKTDLNYGEHVGSKSFTEMIRKHPELDLVLCGHIHPGFGKKDTIGKVKVVNPGPLGMSFDL